MKTLITVQFSVIAAMSYFMIMMYITIDTTTTSNRIYSEQIKACEGRMTYLENVLDTAGIEVVQ